MSLVLRNGNKNLPVYFMLILFVVLVSTPGSVFSQAGEQGILAQMNQKLVDIEHVLEDAQSLQVHVLSPNDFERAQRHFDEAKLDLERGRDVKSIQKNLNRAEEYLAKAIGNAKEAKKQLPFLIQARDDALIANAPEFALELYEQAERSFKDAMEEIEDNDINNAIKRAKDGEDRYRQAELKAIKASIIGKVHLLLDKARETKADRYAPRTYNRAKVLLQEAENILNTDRSAQSTAREKAEDAEYEANHAIFLSDLIQKNRKEEDSWEKVFLDLEDNLSTVSNTMKLDVQYDNGIEPAMESLHLAIAASLDDKSELRKELERVNKELDESMAKNRKLTAELDVSKQQEAGLKETLEVKKRQEAKIKRIEDMYAPQEAVVLREGTNLVIRLVGLNFASGKSVIEPGYFGLLTKVQRAIREFPNAPIVIEGHTDSRGHDAANQKLSEQRSNAVKSYLIANMGLPSEQIQSIGYGKSKPIASNETEDGRRKNRRIDIVLEIGEAIY